MKYNPREGLAILDYLRLFNLSATEINIFNRSWPNQMECTADPLDSTRHAYAISIPNTLFQAQLKSCKSEPKLTRKEKERISQNIVADNHELTRTRTLEFNDRVRRTGLAKVTLNPGEIIPTLLTLPSHRFILEADVFAPKGYESLRGDYSGPSIFSLVMLPEIHRRLYPKNSKLIYHG